MEIRIIMWGPAILSTAGCMRMACNSSTANLRRIWQLQWSLGWKVTINYGKLENLCLQLVCVARYFLERDHWQQGTPSIVAVATCCNDTQLLSTAAVIFFALHRCSVSHHVHYIISIYTSEWTDSRRWCIIWTREDLQNHVKSRAMPSINYQFSVWWIFLRGPGEGAAFGRCSGQDVSGVRQVAERGLLWNTRFLRHETQVAVMVSTKQQEKVKRSHRFL